MGYSKYKKLKEVVLKFHLGAKRVSLFDKVDNVEPSAWLKETLALATILPLTNEKAKAERIISPILSEIAKTFQDHISFFSGEEININTKENLAGECDFCFTLVPQSAYFESPVISLTEAKDEDIEHGIAQCAAQLYGAKLLNEREKKNIPVLYGCTTTGTDWQFMRFENDVFYIDTKIYTNINEVLGMWHTIMHFYIKNF